MENKRRIFSGMLAFAVLAGVATSCDKDDDPSTTEVAIVYTLDHIASSDSVSAVTAVFENVSTGEKTSVELTSDGASQVLIDGLYNVTVSGKASTSINGVASSYNVRWTSENFTVNGGQQTIKADVIAVQGGTGFLFAEIMLSGPLPEGATSYTGDTYFRIFNNSNDTLYADGLCILESTWTTVDKQDYQPDIMSQAMAVQAVYQIPVGDGKTYPVAPKQSILVADIAKNHKADGNSNSFDLSKADFEWYDETASGQDIDVPEVQNLEKVYCYTATIWLPSKQGNRAYALGYIGGAAGAISNESYVSDYAYDYSYMFVFGDFQKEMSRSTYMFPNTWICDAVSFSPSSEHEWSVVDASLDAGYVSIGETGGDANKIGKAARRKFDSKTGALVDTNNSADDFEVVEANPFYEFK